MAHDLKGKRILVAGLGKSGQAAVALCLEQGAQVTCTDSKSREELGPLVARIEEQGARFIPEIDAMRSAFDMLVLSPGIAVDSLLADACRERGAKVIGEVELAGYFLRGPVIGITGSNGKTTTTAMTYHTMQHAGVPSLLGGNIGVPPTALLAQAQDQQWNVLELSSFQLETIRDFRAGIGVCLNVTPDHLDRHHDFATYAAAKRRLFETQRAGDHAVLNASDRKCVSYAAHTIATPLWFSTRERREPGFWLEGDVLQSTFGKLMSRKDLAIPGLHNVENALAAAACVHLAGVPLGRIAEGIATFQGVEHRIEFVRELHGVRYYNDSKATNVDATVKALEAFEKRIWIILGGKDKDSDYRVLRPLLESRAVAALLIGAAAEKIAGQITGATEVLQAGTMDVAVRQAYERAQAGDVVLLAPACASFDQFENYEHRGRVFKQLVHALGEEKR